MSGLDNQNAATETVAQTPVAPVTDAGNSPASTTGPADTAASGQPKEGEEGQPDKPTRDRRAEKRISTLLRKNDEAQREIGYWRGMAEAQKAQPAASADADAKPRPDQFKSYDEFVEALTDWRTDQKLKAHRGSEPKPSQPDGHQRQGTPPIVERLMEDADGVEDIDDVIERITDDKFPGSATMRDYLLESDRPAQLAQWLVDNRKEAKRIYGLTTAAAVRELDKVAATLAKPPAQTSTAPPPVPTVGGRGATSKDLSKLSPEEYAKGWHQRMAAARSR